MELLTDFKKNFAKLTDKEIKILYFMAKFPKKTQVELCTELNLNLTTLQKTDNRRILQKLRGYFQNDAIPNLRQAVELLISKGLL